MLSGVPRGGGRRDPSITLHRTLDVPSVRREAVREHLQGEDSDHPSTAGADTVNARREDCMRAAKVDANQSEIVAALRKIGVSVQPLHTVGKGCPDLLIGVRGINLLLEVKDGNKPPSAQKLTSDQVEWHRTWGGQVEVVNSVEQALIAVGTYAQD